MLARLPRRTAVLVAVLAVALTAVAVSTYASDSRAAAEQERAARGELARELDELRRELAAPAHEAESATSELRLNLAELVTGSERDLDAVAEDRQRLVATLRDAADELDADRDLEPPEAAGVLPAGNLERVRYRLDGLDEQARWVAGHLRATADEVETWAGVAGELHTRSQQLLALQAPDSQRPAELAERWRGELEVLQSYREAAEEAADHDDLAALGEAHLRLVDGLEELAQDAVARLEDGDVDGYNALLEQRLADDDPFGFTAALEPAVEETLEQGPIDAVEEAQERTLGLLAELDELRRVAPAPTGA